MCGVFSHKFISGQCWRKQKVVYTSRWAIEDMGNSANARTILQSIISVLCVFQMLLLLKNMNFFLLLLRCCYAPPSNWIEIERCIWPPQHASRLTYWSGGTFFDTVQMWGKNNPFCGRKKNEEWEALGFCWGIWLKQQQMVQFFRVWKKVENVHAECAKQKNWSSTTHLKIENNTGFDFCYVYRPCSPNHPLAQRVLKG